MSAPPKGPRKATAAELVAGIALLLAVAVVTGSVLRYRLSAAPKPQGLVEPDPLQGTVIVPGVETEGLTYASGPELLFVDSTPGGADVWLDGQNLGPTPYSTNLSCDGAPRALELKRGGYHSATFAIECGRGTARVSATLKKK